MIASVASARRDAGDPAPRGPAGRLALADGCWSAFSPLLVNQPHRLAARAALAAWAEPVVRGMDAAR